MTRRFQDAVTASLASLAAVLGVSGLAHAASAADLNVVSYTEPSASPSGWQVRLTPFAWVPGVNGDATVRGHKVDIDVNVFDLFDSGSSGVELDSLAALMSYMEASKGPWTVYGDVVWGKFGFSDGAIADRNPTEHLSLSASANAGLDYETTIAETGVAYQVARWGGQSASTAVDLLGGARYWNQDLDLSLAIKGDVELNRLGGFKRSGSLAVAKSGTVDWVDPFVGFRVRHELSPGHELQFLGDVGGFGAGSDFSWQLYGGYSFDFTVMHSTLYGVLGYRALAVDYSEGSTARINVILHGPVAGLSFRW